MGSLSDSSNFGAEPVDTQRFYGGERVGQGRWAVLDGLGLLWTDDTDALQLSWTEDADDDAAHAACVGLNRLARLGVPATLAFDDLVAEHSATVESGDLSFLPRP
ncbi:hypothetical protein [Rhodococcoides fascians]|uniref:hypothetical protein n=1 Tax=Rhodococcoides fascians TaxID=1828 RepID=UPI00050CF878|nr:hypothetical protein [Rhodococcus fascians]